MSKFTTMRAAVGATVGIMIIVLAFVSIWQVGELQDRVDRVDRMDRIDRGVANNGVVVDRIEDRLDVIEKRLVEFEPETAKQACLFGAWVTDRTFVIVFYDAGEPPVEQMYLCGTGLGFKPRVPEEAELKNPEALLFMAEFN